MKAGRFIRKMGPICVDIGRPALPPSPPAGAVQTTGDCASCPPLLCSKSSRVLGQGDLYSLLSEESRGRVPLGAADDSDDTSSRHFQKCFYLLT